MCTDSQQPPGLNGNAGTTHPLTQKIRYLPMVLLPIIPRVLTLQVVHIKM
jgi:hypothetical protein